MEYLMTVVENGRNRAFFVTKKRTFWIFAPILGTYI